MATAHSVAQLRDGTASQVRNHTSSHGRHITSHDAHIAAHMVVFIVPEQAILSKTWRMPPARNLKTLKESDGAPYRGVMPDSACLLLA